MPAVIFAIGPVQLLRLARLAGALRILRVGRILKAGRIVRERTGMDQGFQRVIAGAVSVLCAGFVALVLLDPSSSSSQLVARVVDQVGVIGVLVAGAILGAATYVVATRRDTAEGTPPPELPGSHRL